MGIFRRKKERGDDPDEPKMPEPSRRDFSDVDTPAKAEAAHRQGELVTILLVPEAFGGPSVPPNTLYVPPGFEDAKSMIDGTVVRLAREGSVTNYQARPEYEGASVVPTRIVFDCGGDDPSAGGFKATLEIWSAGS